MTDRTPLHVDLAAIETKPGRYQMRRLRCPRCRRWQRALFIVGATLVCRACREPVGRRRVR